MRRLTYIFAVGPLLLFSACSALAQGNTITTVAGGGIQNNIPGILADISSAERVAVDKNGNAYIASYGLNQVFKLNPSGQLFVIAGNSAAGFGGDGGPATSAQLNYPRGVSVDSSGNLFIADTFNSRIRRVDAATQTITTVVGTGSNCYPSTATCGDGGPATSAELSNSAGVTVDSSGNLFIADGGNYRIRRVDAARQTITTVVGTGGNCYPSTATCGDGGPATAAQVWPIGVALDTSGNLFIADSANTRIRRVDAATETITTAAGGGTGGDGGLASNSILVGPYGVAVDSSGNLLISEDSSLILDNTNCRVRRVDAATQIITTLAGNGSHGFSGDGGLATSAQLNTPWGLSVDSSENLFIADSDNNRIRRRDAVTQVITTVAGNDTQGFSGDGGPATSAELHLPTGVALDSSENLFIADWGNNRIRRVDAVTQVISTVAGNGSQGFSGDGGLATSAQLTRPIAVAVDSLGNLFVGDGGNNRIRRVDAVRQVISTVAGNGSQGFSGDGGPATSAALSDFSGVAVDGSGDLFIADFANNRIRKVALHPQDFTLVAAGSSSSATVSPGGTATYTLTATSIGGFNQAVSLACSGAPSEATCQLSQTSLTPSSSGTNVTVTVPTTAPSASAPRSRHLPPVPPLLPGPSTLAMLAVLLAGITQAVRGYRHLGATRRVAFLTLAAGLLLALALAGCGGGPTPPSNPGTPPGTYSLTVTGSFGSGSSALSHSVTLTLKVS